MSTMFLDGKPCLHHNLPDGPLFIVWGPAGDVPVRYVFTKITWARKAAKNMAKRMQCQAAVFYVCALVSWHQEQAGPVSGALRLQIV